MSEKKFLTIDELITYIRQKGLIIDDESKVAEILNSENYYVITGYKNLFLDSDNNYRPNTNFVDIYNLSQFDRNLRILLFDTLLTIESKIKATIINTFCPKYGYRETDILNKDNYNKNHKYLAKTFSIMNRQLEDKKNNHLAVLHYEQEHGFVPLWVHMKLFSFGLVKDIYNVLKDEDKEVIKNILATDSSINIRYFYTIINLLVDTRNDCGHDEIVFNHIHRRIRLYRTKYHTPFKNSYQGKGDMLAKLIAIKYFLSREKYNEFIDKFSKLINDFTKNNNITKTDLLNEMKLPVNYENLKW